MYDPQRGKPINNPLMPWFQAIDQPGAGQMQFGRRLIESRPFLTRVPDDSVIVTGPRADERARYWTLSLRATRDIDGTYAMVYAPVGRSFKVRMDVIKRPNVKAWWFNRAAARRRPSESFWNTGEREFLPPDVGEHLDWVLVLDDITRSTRRRRAELETPKERGMNGFVRWRVCRPGWVGALAFLFSASVVSSAAEPCRANPSRREPGGRGHSSDSRNAAQ